MGIEPIVQVTVTWINQWAHYKNQTFKQKIKQAVGRDEFMWGMCGTECTCILFTTAAGIAVFIAIVVVT
jgi:hypothetical protein